VNTVNNPKPSQKIPLLILLGVLLIGLPLTVITLQQTQFFQQFAWGTRQSATAACSAEHGGAVITVKFTNTEDDKAMDVVAEDIQSGKKVDLGTIEPKETKSGDIITESKELAAGAVKFTLTWSDGSSGEDTRTASYDAVDECSDAPPFCPANPEITEGLCKWEGVEGASGYEVEVTEKETGDVIKKELASESASQSAFPMVPGKAYECKVTPINACTKGPTVKSPEKVCSVPTPTPTVPACPATPNKQGVCKWDPLEGTEEYKIVVKGPDDETVASGSAKPPTTEFKFVADPVKKYVCTVIPVGKCSEGPPTQSPPTSCTVPSPTPTTTPPPSTTPTTPPSPTPTLTPTPTPTPTPTLTPTPTVTPSPTPTRPAPTPTPVVIVRIPPNTLPPRSNPPVQQPPVVVQQPPVVVQQPPVGAAQPPAQQPPAATLAPNQPTPVPTIKPTGTLSNAIALASAAVILLVAGSFLFFLI
jgi:hypothetical protein